MHPWYHSDKPGIAPDCGMKLVPVYASEAPAARSPPGGVEISSARQQLMGVTTAKAEYRTLDQTIRSVGQVAMDETRLVTRPRENQWLDPKGLRRLHVAASQARRPAVHLYSPDLLATEQEYLLALRAATRWRRSSFPEVATGAHLFWKPRGGGWNFGI